MTQKLLQKWCEMRPEALFAVFETGSSWTYAHALEKSWEIGRGLISLGVRCGDAFLSFLPNGKKQLRCSLAQTRPERHYQKGQG